MQLSDLLYDIGKWSGVIGFAFLSFLIFSGDTARYWDKYIVGLDRIIKFQRKFSLITAIFIILHPTLFMISRGIILGFLIPNIAYFPLALGIIGFYIFLAVMIASQLYKRISYRSWQYIHIITYILFFSVIYHAVYWGSDFDDFKLIYLISLIMVSVGIIYRTQYKLRKMYAGHFFVKDVKRETSDTFTLNISQQNKIYFQAGQFCFLRLDKNKLHARHPFTISSAPQDKDISFTIKQSGRFTETASTLKSGEKIEIDGPFGRFIPREDDRELIFIAGGVGITPFMSIIRDRLNRKIDQKITLLYGSKTEADIIFKDELNYVTETWFKCVHILSNDKNPSFPCEQGYISRVILEKYVRNIDNSLFYICGPEVMKTSAKKILAEMNVSKNNIFVEDFFW